MTEHLTQRELLRRRRLPTTAVPLPADPGAFEAATVELTAALMAQQQGPRGTAAAEAVARVEAAKAALNEQPLVTFVLRCLPADEWEALLGMHPPTEKQAEKGLDFDIVKARPALLSATVVPPDGEDPYRPEDWLEFARDGRLSAGEQDALVAAAVTLNRRALKITGRVHAGKG